MQFTDTLRVGDALVVNESHGQLLGQTVTASALSLISIRTLTAGCTDGALLTGNFFIYSTGIACATVAEFDIEIVRSAILMSQRDEESACGSVNRKRSARD